MKQQYDWHGADVALAHALREIYAAQRHRHHRKRVNVLNDLIAAEASIAKARAALEARKEA